MRHHTSTGIWILAAAFLFTAAGGAQDFSHIQIKTDKVRDNLFMLSGGGGNIGVLTGPEGILMIDAMYGELHDKIMAAISGFESPRIRYLILTHIHFDHTGGCEKFGKLGANIIAHGNVRSRMQEEWVHPISPSKIPPYPDIALPAIVYDKALTLHFNGEEIRLLYLGGGHTDGDTVIHFKKANVIHTGDLVFADAYPFIDVPHGGSIDGILKILEVILSMTNSDTKIIPGHGPLYSPQDLRQYRDMLSSLRNRVAEMIGQKKTLDEILAAKPTKEYDARYKLAFPPDEIVKLLYSDLIRMK